MRTPNTDSESTNDKSEDEPFEEFDGDEYDSRYNPNIDEYDDDYDEEGLF